MRLSPFASRPLIVAFGLILSGALFLLVCSPLSLGEYLLAPVHANGLADPSPSAGDGSVSLKEISSTYPTAAPAQGPSDQSLVGRWTFDEGSGTVASDSSSGGNPGSVVAASWTSGKVNNGISFDGSSSFVDMGSAANLTMVNSMTVSAWIYPTGAGSGAAGLPGGIIINKEGEYEIIRSSDGTIQWAIANSNPGWNWINTGYVVPLNQWTHICFIYDNGIIKTYANGTLVHSYNGSGPIGDTVPSFNAFRVGARSAIDQYFQGKIDEVRLYNRALSTAEVQTLVGYSGSSYNDAPLSIPGNIETEQFDKGGEGIAYHDTSPGTHGVSYNIAGNPPSTFRSPTDVDIYEYNGYSGGYLILMQAGDWMNYTVNVATSGTYTLQTQVAWGNAVGGIFHVEIDGVDSTGPIQIPNTGWAFQTLSKPDVQLSAGQHVMRVVADTNAANGYTGDIDYIKFTDPSLVAHWKFDEGSGTAAADASNNGNTGTLQGATWSTGRIGAGALNFNGVDNRVSVPSGASIGNVINNFTLAFWASPRSPHEFDPESTSATTGTSGQRYVIGPQWFGSDDTAGAGVSVGTNGVSVYEHAGNYMPALLVHPASITGWTHITVVYENRQPRLYINGTLARTGLTSPRNYVHINPADIGGMVYGYFDGQLDDMRIYSRVLSVADIARLAGAAPPPNLPPTANAGGPYNATTGTVIQFNGAGSSDPDGTISSYQWAFGDSTTGNGVAPTHTYNTPGTYNVTLTVTDNSGSSTYTGTTATITRRPPIANPGGPYISANGNAVHFDGSASTAQSGTITGYQWNFGDGTTDTGPTPLHLYQGIGTYTASLSVTDSYGMSGSASTAVTINRRPPFANPGGPYRASVGTLVQFNGSSSIAPDGTITSYSWDFGDGTNGSGPSPSHTYNSTGSKTVRLTVTDDSGALNVVTTALNVMSTPQALDMVWVDDKVPTNAIAAGSGESWNWNSSNPAPVSGIAVHTSPNKLGMHQHYFYGASDTMTIGDGDTLFTYVYLDPNNLPSELMMQWNDGQDFEHRAYWGANSIGWGENGTPSRMYMGALPAAGQWVRLEVPASQVGLVGSTVKGMAFTLMGGSASWDRSGKSSPASAGGLLPLAQFNADFDHDAIGQIITNGWIMDNFYLGAGVRFRTSFGSTCAYGDIDPGTSQPNVLSRNCDINGADENTGDIQITFAQPMNNVSFTIAGCNDPFTHCNAGFLVANVTVYDEHGGRAIQFSGHGPDQPIYFNLNPPDFSRISAVTLDKIVDHSGLDLDDLRFTPAPAPTPTPTPIPSPTPVASPTPTPTPTPPFGVTIHYQNDTGSISGSNQPALVNTTIGLNTVVLPSPEITDSYTWSVTGPSGPCDFSANSPCQLVAGKLTDIAIKLKFTQGGNYVVKVVHGRHGTNTPTTVNFNVTQMQVSEVGFSDSYVITPWADNISGNWIPYNPSTEPVWKKDNTPTQNRPSAYKKGAKPHLFATFTIAPVLPVNKTVRVRVKEGTVVIATKNNLTVNANSNSLTVSDLAVTTDLETFQTVKTSDYTLNWEISFDGGLTWGATGDSGAHRVYWIYDDPKTPPFLSAEKQIPYNQLFDLALEKACGSAGGATNVEEIINNINVRVHQDTTYNPFYFKETNNNPLGGYAKAQLQCDEEAMLLRGLLRSIGIDAETKYVWGGDPNSLNKEAWEFGYCSNARGTNWVTMRMDRPLNDQAPASPHFAYHAVVATGNAGYYYDPSYGDYNTFVNADEVYDYAHSTFIEGTEARSHLIFSPYLFNGGQQIQNLRACPHSECQVSNIIDNPSTFVRQQYVDIYHREPDSGGWSYWTNQIIQCGADGLCIDHKRVDVALAFFMESEAVHTDPRFAHPNTPEYNQAFVHQMYAGYLNRTVTDSDPGYLFWLGILNNELATQGTCDYWGMDRAFITSAEYRQRFGIL